jgi:hypothetical protein
MVKGGSILKGIILLTSYSVLDPLGLSVLGFVGVDLACRGVKIVGTWNSFGLIAL